MPGKFGLNIRIRQEKIYQNNVLFFVGFEKVLKIQVGVIYLCRYVYGGNVFCSSKITVVILISLLFICNFPSIKHII